MDAYEKCRAEVEAGPDPVDGMARLLRFREAAAAHVGGFSACVPDPEAVALLSLLLSQSPALSRDLIRDPGRLPVLSADPWLRREKPEAVLQSERHVLCNAQMDISSSLKRFRDHEYLRLGARELGYGRAEEVGRELSNLASACLAGAVEAAGRELSARHGEPLAQGTGKRCRFVVMGMGKLGGAELNFSSDIDLIYLYETDAGAAGKLGLHEYFSRLAERVSRIAGACFRVDLRLRPEGTRGPLVNSLPAAERYYETWARAWERQAWMKARPVAGDLDLGEEALSLLEPIVWPRSGVQTAIEDVQAMMRRIRDELREPDHVKLGPGGIREIEFFVQALQRIHGGRRRELRERGTLSALERLLFAGLVSEREQRALGDAYVFLRRVEHRLQLEEFLQTHAIPVEEQRRERLALRLGYPDTPAFERDLSAHRSAVSAIYETLGRAAEGPPAPVSCLLDPESDRPALERALRALHIRDVEASADEIELLRQKPNSPFSPTATGASARAAPLLLAETAASPDPDLALRRLVDLVTRGAPSEIVFRLAGESPAFARLLVSLLGTSDFLAKILVAHPDLVVPLVVRSGARPTRDKAGHLGGIRARLAELPKDELDHDEEERLDAIRRYKNDELVGIGLRDVAGELSVDEVSAELSALAEACIEATLGVVAEPVFRRLGRPQTAFAVLGLGKLGGGELSYSSDLDLVFLFGDDDAEVEAPKGGGAARNTFEVMSRLGQRLIHGLGAPLTSGRLYEVDTRLRPSGQQGALVSSLAGFRRYHEADSALWERQALIKARTVAGDAALGREAEAIAERHVWGGAPLDGDGGRGAAREIARLRARMERELSREAPGRFNIKSGRGGLLDVEFLVQFLQLVHGRENPALRLRATRPALDALATSGVLDAEAHATLSAGYAFLRRLENRLRIVHDRSISELREDAVELDKLARRLGEHGANPGARVLEEYRAHTEAIRRVYAKHLPNL